MTPASAPIGTPPAIPIDPKTGQPDGTAIYDLLMAKIEPDLVTSADATLDAKYKDETPDQRKARGQRYKAAFEAYDVAYRAYMDGIKNGLNKFQHETLHAIEEDNRSQEQSALDGLDSAISSL